MKIQAQQLKQHLQPLKTSYLISGDEPLLVEEASNVIRAAAKKQNVLERERFSINNSFDWSLFLSSADNLSLFSDKKILELQFAQKPNPKGKDAIKHYLENPNPDITLLIIMPKIDQATYKTTWFKLWDQHCIHLPIWPVNDAQLPGWINTRAKKYQVNLVADTATILAEHVEGNLLAADQELKRLQLLFNQEPIGSEKLLTTISQYSRYDVFGLVDACLNRDSKKVNKIVTTLKAENVEPILILWALSKEVRLIVTLINGIKQRQPFDQLCQSQRIWQSRKPLIQQYLSQTKLKSLYLCLDYAAQIDHIIKGMQPGNVWQALLQMSLLFSGVSVEYAL